MIKNKSTHLVYLKNTFILNFLIRTQPRMKIIVIHTAHLVSWAFVDTRYMFCTLQLLRMLCSITTRYGKQLYVFCEHTFACVTCVFCEYGTKNIFFDKRKCYRHTYCSFFGFMLLILFLLTKMTWQIYNILYYWIRAYLHEIDTRCRQWCNELN